MSSPPPATTPPTPPTPPTHPTPPIPCPPPTPTSQMTAADGKWSCEVCTYENFPLSRKCTMCLAPAPSPPLPPVTPSDPPPPSPDNASAVATVTLIEPEATAEVEVDHAPDPEADAEAEAVADRLRPLRIASPKALHAHPKWACPTCTYENWPKALKCAMCGAPPGTPNTPNAPNTPGWSPSSPPSPPGHRLPNNAHANNGENEVQRMACGGGRQETGAEGEEERRRRRLDWLWLQACRGVVEGNARAVEAYLVGGGDPARALSQAEVALLHRPSAFDAGHTLVHLAIRFRRSEILSLVLPRISGGGPGLKRSPSFAAPDVAAQLRRHAAQALRPPLPPAPAPYLNDQPTFSLPAEIEDLPTAVQEQLFSELLDRDAQRQLEADPPVINWSHEVAERLGSRLHALWNRSLGDCLLDALSQALYGVFDRGGAVRRALADALAAPHAARALFARWSRWERLQALGGHGGHGGEAQYAPAEGQLRAEWARLAAAAARPGAPLAQLHVFALAQVVRRPVLVYGVRLVRSFRGEALGLARFQGLYLPLLWPPELCGKAPLALGYTRGHFSALVALEPPPRRYICPAPPGGPDAEDAEEQDERCVYLPLVDAAGQPLPVPFALRDEPQHALAADAARWLSVRRVGGVPCARQALPERPLLVAQMLEEWLNHYRRLAQQTCGPAPGALKPRLATAGYCSGTDTDDE